SASCKSSVRTRETPEIPMVCNKTAWRTAARNAGLADRRIYDLRSTFARRANMCHATGLTVAHLLGHASTQILPTYVRPLDENTRALIEAFECSSKETVGGLAFYQLKISRSSSLTRNAGKL